MMRKEEYILLTQEGNALDFRTLIETKKQLRLYELDAIETEIDRVLLENKILKPEAYTYLEDTNPTYYLIDLDLEQIESIVSMFGDLEAGNVGLDYQSTHSANVFAKLLDKWNELPYYK